MMKTMISALALALTFMAGSVYANTTMIGEGVFSDGQYETSQHGGLSAPTDKNLLSGTDYYATAYSYWDSSQTHLNALDPGDSGTFTLKWGSLSSSTFTNVVGSVDTTWSGLLAGFDACFDSENSGSFFVLGLKQACFTNNILNMSDLPAGNSNGIEQGAFFGHIGLFMTTDDNTAVPAPGTTLLFALGLLALGFAAYRRRQQF